MKIKKFNENNEQPMICLLTIDKSDEAETFAFIDKESMNNWILNRINNVAIEIFEDVDEDTEGLTQNESGQFVFIDVDNAISWYEDTKECTIYRDELSLISNVKLKYDVDKLITYKKYNV